MHCSCLLNPYVIPARPSREPTKAGTQIRTAVSASLLVISIGTRKTLDIPAGPNNRIEPGGPDQGQPTHFLPRRQWGVFTITVPKDFGDKKLTWTLVANGQTT